MRIEPGTVRQFALYGTQDASPAWADLVHLERVPERSSLFGWEIDLHFHEGLIQVLYLTAGGAGGSAETDDRRGHTVGPGDADARNGPAGPDDL